jgi:FtsH-binding integral membrane protein
MSYIGNTYLHLLGALGVVLLSMNNSFIHGGISLIISVVLSLALFFVVLYMTPGPFKYIVFFAYLVVLGQSLGPFTQNLKKEGVYYDVLASVVGIFVAMTAVGFYTKDKLLGFGPMFFAALIGLLLARIGVFLFGLSGGKTDTISNILSWFATIIFGGLVAYDTQLLKKRIYKNDYINACLDLFLDILNLFTSVGDIMDD